MRIEDDNKIYYYDNYDQLSLAQKGDAITKMAHALVVVDIRTNELLKCRLALSHIVDTYFEKYN